MNKEKFVLEIDRLKDSFGAKAFGVEFCKVLWCVVEEGSDKWMKQTVNVFIGERKPNNPPRVVDFRESFHKDQQRNLSGLVNQVSSQMEGSFDEANGGLKAYLEYLGVKTIQQAVNKIGNEMKTGVVGARFKVVKNG